MSEKLPIYSKHIFLFPFRWDATNRKGEALDNLRINERCNIKAFDDLLDKQKWIRETGNDGKRKGYYIDEFRNYNEYVYFYDFVRDALYDEECNNEGIVQHYTYNVGNNATYKIDVKQEDWITKEEHFESYLLDLTGIFLHLFNNGVGVLSYHLKNSRYKEDSEILRINDFGRRIYPQFLSNVSSRATDKVKYAFLANQITLSFDDCFDDFTWYNLNEDDKKGMNRLARQPIKLPDFILKLLNKKGNEKIKCSSKDLEAGDVCIRPLIDDRMFTICWYGNNETINKLKAYPKQKSKIEKDYAFHSSEFWYKYVFVDGGWATCQNRNMLRCENIKHTYERFTDDGTLWGVSRYSLMALTDLEYFGRELISTHATTIYYQMVVLCLMQRASVLKYSNEIARISRDVKNKHFEIEEINESYLKFMNKMYFREITAQDQGIELYDMLQKNMRIEREVKDLNREIDEIYQFASLVNAKNENEKITNLTILGAIFLVPSLLVGFLGINIMPDFESIPEPYWDGDIYFPFLFVSLAVLFISGLFTFLFNYYMKLGIWKKAKRLFRRTNRIKRNR
ncbi:hypothetical protein EMN47_10730 [Prolixibacteraceae bacterium JC049]|nr:hypothetical protein [Prolixibacteraceae bacterium JC049]